MYPSDYGYATDFSKCSNVPYDYHTEGCYDNDWLNQTSTVQWLLTPYTGNYYRAMRVTTAGRVFFERVFDGFEVRPVLYLDSDIDIKSGNAGTSTDPYRISLR